MTKHNLNQHLRWLLGCLAIEPLQPAYGPPPPLSVENALSLPQDIERFGPETVVEEASGNADSSARQSEFARPNLPASILNAQAENEMARLQSGPKSSNKPRLLSEHIPVALQTPTSTSIQKPGTSLRDQYSAQWQCRPPGTQGQFYCAHVSEADEFRFYIAYGQV